MKKIINYLIILFGIILINTLPLAAQGGGGGTECIGDDNVMELQNYGWGSCQDLLSAGYPIGADPMLDELCCATFSAYSNGNCPGDNIYFVNNNLGFSSCSDFLSMTGYPIGMDPTIDQMCCGTISSACSDNTNEINNMGFANCSDFLSMTGYPIGADPYIEDICCGTISSQNSGCTDNIMELQNSGWGSCQDLLSAGYPIGADPFLDLLCCETFSGYENGECPGDNMDFVNNNLGFSSCSEFFEITGYPIGADPTIDQMCCGTISDMPNGDSDCTDNLMEIQNYGYGSCADLIADGYPIGYDPMLDQLCCETFSGYENGECPGDNMDYVNNNLGFSSCSEFFMMTGYPTGADPTIDQMCCGTISDMSNVVHGCMDPGAFNYNSDAMYDDGSCVSEDGYFVSMSCHPVHINGGYWDNFFGTHPDIPIEPGDMLIVSMNGISHTLEVTGFGGYSESGCNVKYVYFDGDLSDIFSGPLMDGSIIQFYDSGDTNQSGVNYGHYGPGGVDSVLWDPDLEWTCNGCNALDLIDADTVMGMSTNMFVGVCYNLDAYSTEPMDNESCMSMDYSSVWVGFNNEYVCEDNEDELINLMTDGMTSDEIDMQMQMINDAGGACNFVIPFAFGDPLVESLCCESISNFDPSNLCESGDCIQDCYGMWLDHSTIDEFYGNGLCDDFMNCEMLNFDGGDCGNLNTYIGTWDIQSWIQEGEEGITDDANAYFNFYEWGEFSVGFNDQINFGQFEVTVDNEIIIMPSPDESITFSVYTEGDMMILTDEMGEHVITLMATESIFGCLDSNNPSYNQDANAMDYSTCETGCFDEIACNFGQSDAVYCDYNCCTNPNACNFGEEADCEMPEYSCDCDGNIPDYSNVGWEVDLVAVDVMENSDVHIIGFWHDSLITSEIHVNLQHGWDNTFVGNFDGPPNATFSYYVVVDGVEYGNCNGEPYQIGFNDLDYDNPCMVWNNTNAISPNNCAEMYDCNGPQYNEIQWIDQAYSLIGNGECESDWIGWYTFNCEEFDYENGDCSPDNCDEYIEIDVPLELASGWNMIGYTCWEPINAIDAFTDISNKIEIVKDGWGMAYIPDWEFNGLGNFEYGKGYQIKMLEQVDGFQFCKTIIKQ